MKYFLICCLACAAALSAHATAFTFKPVDSFGGDSNVNDLGDLEHRKTYTWGITSTSSGPSYTSLRTELGLDYQIASAVLTIKNLYNWDSRDTSNQLFIHLLDNPRTGVRRLTDNPNDNGINQGVVSDYFAGKVAGNFVNGKWKAYGYANTAAGALLPTGDTNLYLTQYHDPNGPGTKDQFTFVFTNAQLGILEDYILNGHTGGSNYADFGLGFDPDCHFFNDGVKLVINTAPPPPRIVAEGGSTTLLLGLGLLALFGCRRRLSLARG